MSNPSRLFRSLAKLSFATSFTDASSLTPFRPSSRWSHRRYFQLRVVRFTLPFFPSFPSSTSTRSRRTPKLTSSLSLRFASQNSEEAEMAQKSGMQLTPELWLLKVRTPLSSLFPSTTKAPVLTLLSLVAFRSNQPAPHVRLVPSPSLLSPILSSRAIH